jgi:pimeloyl-ACP methyl ester carboxylesterase
MLRGVAAVALSLGLWQPLQASQGAAQLPRFTPAPCSFDTAPFGAVDCGRLEVLQDRAKPQGRTLKLSVAIARATGPQPAPDPVIYFSGGPGDASVGLGRAPQLLASPAFRIVRERRDLILFDQRGTGESEPKFCPSLTDALYTSSFEGLAPDALLQRQVSAIAACRKDMLAQDVDLGQYNSIASALDVQDLRRALNLGAVNLLGHSYGTRLALTILREHPQDIRSVALSGVYPPDDPAFSVTVDAFAQSLDNARAVCAADPACATLHPDLRAELELLLADYARAPFAVPVDDRQRFPAGRIVLDGRLLGAGLFQALYDRNFVPVLPLFLRETRARNADVMSALAEAIALSPSTFSHGMHLAVSCFENGAEEGEALWRAAAARHPWLSVWHTDGRFGSDFRQQCDAFHPHRATADQRAPARSETPVLMISGAFDPITPAAFAAHAARTLPNATQVVLRSGSHFGLYGFNDCTRGLLRGFLDQPDLRPNLACIDAVPATRMITDVRLTPGLAALAGDLRKGKWMTPVVLATSLVVLLSVLLAWPVQSLLARRRGRTAAQGRAARWALGAAAIFALSFTAGLAWAAGAALTQTPYLLLFGVPTAFAPLFVLPWLLAGAAVLAAAYAVRAWQHKWWSRAARVHFVLAAVAALVLAVLLPLSGLA